MNRRALTALLLLSLPACRDELASAPPRIEGRVIALSDPDAPRGVAPVGQPLDDVRVTVEGLDTQSDARGRFELRGVSRNERLLLRFERDGYAPVTLPVTVSAEVDVVSVDVSMVPRGRYTVQAAEGATISRAGTTVEIRPSAFVDGAGNPVDGAVQVFFTPVAPNSDGTRGTPGDMTAYDANWAVQPLLSLLMFELSAEQNGERVFFTEATKLTVDVNAVGISLPEGWENRSEQGIPFWSFGDEMGRWVPSNTVHFEGSFDEPMLVVEVPGVDMDREDWRFRCAPDQICLDGSDNTPGEGEGDTGDTGDAMNIIGGTSAGPTNVTMSAAQMRAVGAPARCNFTSTAPLIATCTYFCTGTVITDNHVLTAAHCVDDMANGATVANLGFVVGDSMANGSWEHVIPITRIWWDTTYTDDGGATADVAILELANAIDDSSVPVEIMPISLFEDDLTSDLAGRAMEHVGYGRTNVGGNPRNTDRNWLGTTIASVSSTVIRSSTTATQSTCSGDSGGPWLMMDSGSVKQIGVHHGSGTQAQPCSGNASAAAMDDIYPWIAGIVGQANLPADPVPSMPGSYGPPPQWFNIDMFGTATGIQGDVVDAVGEPLAGAYVSMWTEEGPSGHTYTHTDADGHFSVYPVNANSTLAISAAVTVSGAAATSGSEDIVYGGIDAWETPDGMPRSPSSAYGTIEPNPIVIPICTIAGEITLASVDDPTTGRNVLASAFFWDNTDERVPCVEAAEEFWVDECEVRPRDAASGGTEGFSTQWQPDAELESVGSSISVRGGLNLTIAMPRAEGPDGPFYAGTLSGSAANFMTGPFRINAGGFTTTAVLDPDAPSMLGTWSTASTTKNLNSSTVRTITWTAQGDADAVLFLSLIPDDVNGDALHCAMRNDGAFTLPADLVSSLPTGGYTAAFYYESRGYAAIGDGTAARTRALSVVQRDARR